jgi:hypothetical protein
MFDDVIVGLSDDDAALDAFALAKTLVSGDGELTLVRVRAARARTANHAARVTTRHPATLDAREGSRVAVRSEMPTVTLVATSRSERQCGASLLSWGAATEWPSTRANSLDRGSVIPFADSQL